MTETEEEIVQAMKELADANRTARRVMEEAERLIEIGVQAIKAVARITDTLRLSTASEQREASNAAIHLVVDARQRSPADHRRMPP